jgi:hypothetical protein
LGPVQIFVLAAALCFIVAGIAAGEMAEVFKKAIFVCLECIGIG